MIVVKEKEEEMRGRGGERKKRTSKTKSAAHILYTLEEANQTAKNYLRYWEQKRMAHTQRERTSSEQFRL